MNFTFNIGELLALIGLIGGAVGLAIKWAVGTARIETKLSALKEATGDALAALKAEHTRSAGEQGYRLGELETARGVFEKFIARMEGATEKEREMSGVIRTR